MSLVRLDNSYAQEAPSSQGSLCSLDSDILPVSIPGTGISLAQPFLNQITTLYQTTVFNTEDSDKAKYLNTFSWAGTSKSTYSFGLLQFDVGGNDNAYNFLADSGYFSDAQLTQLTQHGGLTQAQVGTLNTALQSYLATQQGTNAMNAEL